MGRPSRSTASQRPLWKITFPSSPESEDALSEVLLDLTGQRPSLYHDAETQKSVAHLYLPAKPSQAEVQQLTSVIQRVRQSGLQIPPGKIGVERLRTQDWAESWKRHFKSLQIGSRLVIRPSWITRPIPKRCAVVVLDPGLSFGTGQHPTTRFCLEQLVSRRRKDQSQCLLDVGSGSGILAIAAAKLGYRPVDALEIDPEAVRIARRNVRKNRLDRKVRITCKDLALFRPARRYDVICANLIFDLLIVSRDRLLRSLAPEGTLVLAGILKTQFPRVVRVYEEIGFELIARRAEGEWESGAFASGD